MLRGKSKGYLLLLLGELLCVMLLLPGCFQQSRLVYSFYGQNVAEEIVEEDGYREFCGDRMNLLPGIYEIRVQTRLADGERMSVEMLYDEACYKALLGNSVSVLPESDKETFSVWVLDKVSAAYVQCTFYDADPKSLVSLEVYRTGKGSRVCLFLALVVFVILDVLVEYRRLVLEGKIFKRQQVVFWTLLAGVLLAYFPYLTDYFSIGKDTLSYLTWIVGLRDALGQGSSLLIKLQNYWHYGRDNAVSMLNGGLFLFFPAGLLLLGFPLMTSYKIFILVLLGATAIITYHSFYKCVKDEYAALFGSMLYLLIPYHIFNMYNMGAVGECLARAFLPLVVCGMYLLYTGDMKSASYKKYKWYLVWGISAVLLSHLVFLEVTVVSVLAFCVIFWRRTFRRETFLQLLEAAGIVLLVNMWFWLPMLYRMDLGVYHLQNIVSMYDSSLARAGAGVFMLLVVYLLWRGRGRAQTWDRTCKILAIFSILTIVMSSRYFPWDAMMNIPGIGFIFSSLQFPGGWMMPATLFAALFATFLFAAVQEAGDLLMKSALGVAAVLVVCSAVYHVNSIAFESEAVFLYEPRSVGSASMEFGELLLKKSGTPLVFYAAVAVSGVSLALILGNFVYYKWKEVRNGRKNRAE